MPLTHSSIRDLLRSSCILGLGDMGNALMEHKVQTGKFISAVEYRRNIDRNVWKGMILHGFGREGVVTKHFTWTKSWDMLVFAQGKGYGEVYSEQKIAWIKAKKHKIARSSVCMECKIPVGLDEKMVWSRSFWVPRKELEFYLVGHGEPLKDFKLEST